MAQYTFEAFRWSGTGYNSQYNESHSVTIVDNDERYEGYGDSDEKISVDGGASQSSSGQPYSIDVAFTDTSGQSHIETFEFFNAGGSWYFIPDQGSEFTVGATLGNYQSHTVGWKYEDIACFCAGTFIETDQGSVLVEELKEGAFIKTFDDGFEKLRKRLSRELSEREVIRNPKLSPVRIEKEALGCGLPKRDLLVSPQHRMLIRSKPAKRMFGDQDVLVAAHRLTALPNISKDRCKKSIKYFHLVFDAHQIVFANGAPSESFYPGKQAMAGLTPKAREEFTTIYLNTEFGASDMEFARSVPANRKQRKLVERHLKNAIPLLAEPV